MRKKIIALVSTVLILNSFSIKAQSVLYFNFVSHNEEVATWSNPTFYGNNRNRLITLGDYFALNGITWNMQSDRVYLLAVISLDTGSLQAVTNSKNILRYLYEDKGVEMDPHGHETVYFYPDLVHLMDSIGLPESKIMGGTIYDGMNGNNVWTNMSNGENGVIFPWVNWQPDYLWGPGTPNHVNDPKYFGVWNPQDTINFLTHDTAQHIRLLATGCEIKVKNDSVTVDEITQQIKDVITHVEDLTYPANGFYMQTIFFEQGDINNAAFYNKLLQVADSVDLYVTQGHGQWKTLKQMYTEWETTYGAQMFMWECGDIVGIDEQNGIVDVDVYPNPSNGEFTIDLPENINPSLALHLTMFNLAGSKVLDASMLEKKSIIDISTIAPGIYFYYLMDENKMISRGKMIRN